MSTLVTLDLLREKVKKTCNVLEEAGAMADNLALSVDKAFAMRIRRLLEIIRESSELLHEMVEDKVLSIKGGSEIKIDGEDNTVLALRGASTTLMNFGISDPENESNKEKDSPLKSTAEVAVKRGCTFEGEDSDQPPNKKKE